MFVLLIYFIYILRVKFYSNNNNNNILNIKIGFVS